MFDLNSMDISSYSVTMGLETQSQHHVGEGRRLQIEWEIGSKRVLNEVGDAQF